MTPDEARDRQASGDPFSLGYAPEGPVASNFTFDPSLPRSAASRIVPSFQKTPLYDQQGGTCVGNSVCGAFTHLQWQETGEVWAFDGEELNARVTHAFDTPTSFRPVMDSVLATGLRTRNGHGLFFPQGYANVDYRDVEAMKAAIDTPGQMMVIATHLIDGWDRDPKTYREAGPDPSQGGLHAMLVVAYDARGVICQNSWGQWFGDGGHVRLAWSYVVTHFVEAMVITDKADVLGGYVKTYQPPNLAQEYAVKHRDLPDRKRPAVYLLKGDGRFWIKDIWEAKRYGVDLNAVQQPPDTDPVWALPVIGPDAPPSQR